MPKVLWIFLAYGTFVGPPLAALMLVKGWDSQREFQHIATLPSDGSPAAFQGTLTSRVGLRRTPMGARVAGWSGAVRSSMPSGKSPIYRWHCRRAELSDLELDGAPLSLPTNFHFLLGDLDLLTGFGHGPHSDPFIAGETVISDRLPSEAGFHCPLPPPAPREQRVWIEQRLPSGAFATFIGCRDDFRLTGCAAHPPGDESLFVGSRRALVARLLSTSLGMTAGMTILVIFFAFVAAGYTFSQLYRYQDARSS